MFDCQPGARAVRGSWLSAQPLPLTPLAKEEEEEEEGRRRGRDKRVGKTERKKEKKNPHPGTPQAYPLNHILYTSQYCDRHYTVWAVQHSTLQ